MNPLPSGTWLVCKGSLMTSKDMSLCQVSHIGKLTAHIVAIQIEGICNGVENDEA